MRRLQCCICVHDIDFTKFGIVSGIVSKKAIIQPSPLEANHDTVSSPVLHGEEDAGVVLDDYRGKGTLLRSTLDGGV